MNSPAAIAIIVVIVIIVFVALWQRDRSRKLRAKFGPEYDRLVQQERGDKRRAEAILMDRQRRVGKLNIQRLSPEAANRFAGEWRMVQETFVDDPRGAVSRADMLVNEALQARGYPMGDFEQRAADISVEHPGVVENYRIAHDVAAHAQSGHATTEDLRKAMQRYRNLFEDILDVPVTHREEVHQ
ncbi:MAG TPA: hypothetical protein VH639_08105 [Bryobacteraceae bacterium]|jgi:FtsZ-interacting cell division protein ZipA